MRKYLVTAIIAITLCMILLLTGCFVKASENTAVEPKQEQQDSDTDIVADDESKNIDEGADDAEASIGEEVQSTFVSYETEQQYSSETDGESGQLLVSGVYDLIHITSEDTPQLKNAIEQWNIDRNKEYSEFFAQSIEAAKEDFKENADFWTDRYESQADCMIKRSGRQVFSFLVDWYTYMGGAHGNSTCSGYNYDVQTGEIIELTNIVSDVSLLPDILEEKLLENYESDIFLDPDLSGVISSCYSEFSPEGYSNLPFIVGYEGITIFFNAYDLSYYAAGSQEVTLLYQDYPELLNPAYFSDVPESYVVPFNQTETISTGVSSAKTISIEGELDEYDTYTTIVVSVDDQVTKQECYTYRMDPYYVKMNDKSYLYIQMKAENDYQTFMVFDISGDTAVYVNELDGFLMHFANPENFKVEEGMSLLSNYGGTRMFHVGNDGMPVCDSKDYAVEYDLTITSTVDLEGKIIDADTGEATGTAVFPAGTDFTFLHTDDNSYVQMEASDGRTVQFEVTMEWPQMINGKEAVDCFEQLWYAG